MSGLGDESHVDSAEEDSVILDEEAATTELHCRVTSPALKTGEKDWIVAAPEKLN